MENTNAQKIKNTLEEKYGKKIAATNYTQIPNILFFRRQLGITYTDFYFICFVLSKKYGSECPYFSLNKIGRELHMPSATRNDVLKRLRKKGYLETIPKKEKLKGKGRYYFDLSGLFVALEYHIDHGLHLTKDHLKEETEIRTTTNTQGAKDMSSLMEEKYGFQTTQQKPTG